MARGPAYPYVNLSEAIELTKKMYVFTKRSPASTDSVIKEAWGASPTSSSSVKIIAALKYFGLIEDGPNSEKNRTIKITDRAYRILVDSEDSPERKQAIKDAALSPKWYQFVWNIWGADTPASMRSTLLIEHNFVDSTVDSFIKDYRATIAYAGLTGAGEKAKVEEPPKKDEVSSADSVKIGDYIQWESEGALQFTEPRKVRAVQEHEGRQWVFVEGSETGIPMNQVKVEQKGMQGGTPPPRLPEDRPTDIRLDTKEREWLRGPLSKEASYRIIVSGELGPKEIGKLIKLLEAQKAVLSDDEPEGSHLL